MATWGSQTWGYENWGTLGDVTITLSGQSTLSTSVGSVQVQQVPGWGTQYWGAGEWGDLVSPEALVTGNQLNVTSQTVTAFTDVSFNITGQQLTSSVNSVLPGISQLIPSNSFELNADTDGVFGGELVIVNVASATTDQWGEDAWGQGQWGIGDGISSQTGTVTARAGAGVSVTGLNNLNTTANTVLAGTAVNPILTGIELNATLGDEFAGPNIEVQVTSPSDDAWGNEAYGEGAWGVGDGTSISIGNPLLIGSANVTLTSPNALSISEGIVDPAPDAMVIGVGMTITSGVGTVTASANTGTTGVEAVVTTNAVSITADANIDTTGSQITGNTGQLEYEAIYSFDGSQANITAGDAFGGEVVEIQVTTASAVPWGYAPYGEGQWGQGVGTDIGIGGEEVAVPSVEVDVSGEQLQTFTGQETITADANITLTGLSLLDIQLGDEDAFTNVRVNVTGQQLGPFVIGDYAAGISIIVEPTGVTSTVSTGIMGINAWAVVDPGTAPTWTVVDIAA